MTSTGRVNLFNKVPCGEGEDYFVFASANGERQA
jgi:hypothetical protein